MCAGAERDVREREGGRPDPRPRWRLPRHRGHLPDEEEQGEDVTWSEDGEEDETERDNPQPQSMPEQGGDEGALVEYFEDEDQQGEDVTWSEDGDEDETERSV